MSRSAAVLSRDDRAEADAVATVLRAFAGSGPRSRRASHPRHPLSLFSR
jgi:hypothetical protein